MPVGATAERVGNYRWGVMAVSQQRLQELFHYNPLTGDLTRRVTVSPNAKAGDVVGVKRPDAYLAVRVDGSQYLVHRLIYLYVTGDFPPEDVDHEDLNKANNAWSNLRPASQTLNNANKAIQSNNTVGFKGVSRHNGGNKFRADIKINGTKTYLGCYSTPEEAHAVYVAAANDQFGEFARAA